MKLVAYLDESGRHDKTGKLKGSEHILVTGYLGWDNDWADFCTQWQSVLDKYGVAYFHFSEWAEASAVVRGKRQASSSFARNPYKDWSHEKLDGFLLELARIAGAGTRLIVGGWISTFDFQEASKHPMYRDFVPPGADPYKQCLIQFFQKFSDDVQAEWRYWKEPVTFIFDQCEDRDWTDAVRDAFSIAKQSDTRLAELSFADKKVMPYLPLQAADMLAYRFNQIARKFDDPAVNPKPSETDLLMMKPMFKSFDRDFYRGLMDFLSAAPLRYSSYPWRARS